LQFIKFKLKGEITNETTLNTFYTRDNLKIRYALRQCQQVACRGTVVLLGGRSEFIEKYSETIDELDQRRYAVYTFDWRGQGLSDRLLANRYKGFVHTYDDYLTDLTDFMRAIVQPQAVTPVILLAHSMGAHIALRYMHDKPEIVAKAVLTSSLVDIAASGLSKDLIKRIVRLVSKAGFRESYATRSKDFDPTKKRFVNNRLTSDPNRFRRLNKLIVGNPDLATGGVTFGWLDAMFRSIEKIRASEFAERIMTPTLFIAAGDDAVVSIEAQRDICRRMPNCRMVTIPHARHEIMIETDTVRSAFWEAFDGFVK
jgi:lysophospholipase